MPILHRIAQWLAPERERQLNTERVEFQKRVRDFDIEVNSRVADIILKMDPYEPFLKKYNVIFSENWEKSDDRLDDQSRLSLYMWAYGFHKDVNFQYLIDWTKNTQGNAAIRKASNEKEWFFARACIITIELLVEEIGRLSSHYQAILDGRKQKGFDKTLAVE